MLEPVERYHDLIRTDVFPVLPERLGSVLDFGGGVGATSSELKRIGRASRVTVADLVAGQLGEVDFTHLGDLEDGEFVDKVIRDSGPFDTILALDILEHLRDPWRAVKQLRDGLTPDGVLVASIPNVNYYGLVAPLVLSGRYVLTDSGILDRTHIRWFARHGAIELLSAPGLTVEEVRPNLASRRASLADKVTFGVFRRFFALQYIIRARRTS